MFPLPVHVWFEIGAALVASLCWYKLKRSTLVWFIPFLWFIVVVELTGRYLNRELHEANAWLYNISVPVEYLFYAFIFRAYFKIRSFKIFARMFMGLFLSFVLINIIFIQGFQEFNTNILKAGSFFMIILSFLYFVELLRQERQTYLLNEPVYWVATGVFLFNTGEFFYTLFSDYLIKHHLDKARHIFSSINNNLILVLYTCLAISFLCTKSRPQKA